MRKTALALSILLTAAAAHAQTSPSVLKIDADKPVSKVSPELYGLMTEEINYSYDGGLLAELVRNRTIRADWSGVHRWYLVEKGNSRASMQVDKTTGPSAALPGSLKLTVDQADASSPAGVTNEGYWGILVTPNTAYKGSFYAKSDSASPITIQLTNHDPGKTAAQAVVPALSGDWKKYDFTLKTGKVAAGTANH